MKKLNEIYEKINDSWNKLWKRIDNSWRKIKQWKYWEVLAVIFLTISLILILVFFNALSAFLFTSENRNGELAKVLLSIFGGIGLFYGLFINSRRIKEQTRQNCISENSNSDKRFSYAIGYLGSDKTSIVLGGVYALYQLAKEDKRYISIVASLFTSYLRENSFKLLKSENNDRDIDNIEFIEIEFQQPVIIETLFNLLFNNDGNIFYYEKLDLSNTVLCGLKIKNDIQEVSFNKANINSCSFDCNIDNCTFHSARINYCSFGKDFGMIKNSDFGQTQIDQTKFIGYNLNNLNFYDSNLMGTIQAEMMINCDFRGSFYVRIEIIGVKEFNNTIFNEVDKDSITFSNCVKINDSLFD